MLKHGKVHGCNGEIALAEAGWCCTRCSSITNLRSAIRMGQVTVSSVPMMVSVRRAKDRETLASVLAPRT